MESHDNFRIVVGSKNPVKINAVIEAAKLFWAKPEILAFDSSSRVSKMPISVQEARIGALNRARTAFEKTKVDIAIAHEGGVTTIHGDWYLFATVVSTNTENYYWGGEIKIKLPEAISSQIGDGSEELGSIMDRMLDKSNTKQKAGAIGYLSRGYITRQEAFRFNSIQALIPWVR